MSAPEARVTDYDAVAERFDRRYSLYGYDGVRDTVLNFVGPVPAATLEVGCGTGYWLAAVDDNRRLAASAEHAILAGVDPSAPMLARARGAAPGARLVRGRAEALPWRDAAFDRIFCVNAMHHFGDRHRFFAEARRLLKPGGAVLTIGKDPHTERDTWWVYDYFEETRDIDLARFARVRTLRGDLATAGFGWAESFEADHIDVIQSAAEALATGVVDCRFTSQLTVLSHEEYARGVARLRAADAEAGGQLQLVADFRLYATIGWVG